jgi:hypothetical protein
MAYAEDTATFPHDSTADQWFDDHQYAAYTELGRQLGNAATFAMTGEQPAEPDEPTLRVVPGEPDGQRRERRVHNRLGGIDVTIQ